MESDAARTIDGEELGLVERVLVAGTPVGPGRYRRVDGPERVVDLPLGGHLPPSFDGTVALYVRLLFTPPDRRRDQPTDPATVRSRRAPGPGPC